MKNTLMQIKTFLMQIVGFIFIRLLPLIIYIIAVYYSYILLRDMTVDTTSITNSAFAIIASLAALSFSCSRTLIDSKESQDRFAYSGERFFHSSVLLISASLIKYSVLSINDNFANSDASVFHILSLISGVYISTIFFWSVTSATGALIIINKLLWQRFNRYPEWDYFI